MTTFKLVADQDSFQSPEEKLADQRIRDVALMTLFHAIDPLDVRVVARTNSRNIF